MAGFRQRRRTRVSWLVVFALLFQQLTLSAYACTLTTPPPEAVATSNVCSGMAMPATAVQSSPLCAKHCAPERATTSPPLSVTVPPLALPPPSFDLLSNPPTIIDRRYDVSICRSDPPPLLRFCSLQI